MKKSLFEHYYPDQSLHLCADSLIALALNEDMVANDITSLATIPENSQGKATLKVKQSGIICGLDLVPMILSKIEWMWTQVSLSGKANVSFLVNEGESIEPGQDLLRLQGSLRVILAAERTIINFIQHLSGIATLTQTMTQLLANSRIQLLDTRKTLPGYRLLEKYAVRCGHANNHRLSLSDMFLIKENHIRAAGSLERAIRQCQDFRQKNSSKAKIEVEVTNMDEFTRAHALKVDRIMLDHFTKDMVYKAASLNRPEIPLELSGNITLENLSKIKDYPIHYLSSGAITHSAPALDISLLMDF